MLTFSDSCIALIKKLSIKLVDVDVFALRGGLFRIDLVPNSIKALGFIGCLLFFFSPMVARGSTYLTRAISED